MYINSTLSVADLACKLPYSTELLSLSRLHLTCRSGCSASFASISTKYSQNSLLALLKVSNCSGDRPAPARLAAQLSSQAVNRPSRDKQRSCRNSRPVAAFQTKCLGRRGLNDNKTWLQWLYNCRKPTTLYGYAINPLRVCCQQALLMLGTGNHTIVYLACCNSRSSRWLNGAHATNTGIDGQASDQTTNLRLGMLQCRSINEPNTGLQRQHIVQRRQAIDNNPAKCL